MRYKRITYGTAKQLKLRITLAGQIYHIQTRNIQYAYYGSGHNRPIRHKPFTISIA